MKWLKYNLKELWESNLIGAFFMFYVIIPVSIAFLFALTTRTHHQPAIMILNYTIFYLAIFAGLYLLVGIKALFISIYHLFNGTKKD